MFECLDLNSRTCPLHECINGIEDEKHVILQCPQYDDIRQQLLNRAVTVNENIIVLNDLDKLVFLFTNVKRIKPCAKTCFQILQSRQNILYKLLQKLLLVRLCVNNLSQASHPKIWIIGHTVWAERACCLDIGFHHKSSALDAA